jgi:hypothetical protein
MHVGRGQVVALWTVVAVACVGIVAWRWYDDGPAWGLAWGGVFLAALIYPFRDRVRVLRSRKKQE